jgi:L-lactate dehydrogenase
MKVAIVGAGYVGASCAQSLLLRGSCHELVLLDKKERLAKGVALDLSHGELVCRSTRVSAGSYVALAGASVVVVTAGINEKEGKANSRDDKEGRLLLLPRNARVYADVIPKIASVAPDAIILVVTDPPDALADIARRHTKTNPVLSAGTFLDTLRFRIQIADRLGCHPKSVDAMVIGEHGTSQVYVWSSATVGGQPVLDLLNQKARDEVEQRVKYANIEIIDGTGASQRGIGIVTARIVEAILRDEGLVATIGQLQSEYGVTYSLPSVIGREGITRVFEPSLSKPELEALKHSARTIADAVKKVREEETTEKATKARKGEAS